MKSTFQSLRFYGAVAPEYDEIVGETTYAAELEPFLKPRANSIRRVLDVGPGTGKTIEAILEMASRTRSSPSVSPTACSKSWGRRIRTSTPSATTSSATSPPIPKRSTSSPRSAYLRYSGVEPIVAALAAKLNPGGLFVFTYEPLLPDHATQSGPEKTYRVEDSPRITCTTYREAPQRDDGPVELRFVAALRPG